MPKLGFDMSSGKVVRWLKNEGETVHKGDAVLEIETDKATVEVQADADGVLGKILVREGDVPVGERVGEIVGAGEERGASSREQTVTTRPKVDGPSDTPFPSRQMPTPPAPTDKTRAEPQAAAAGQGPQPSAKIAPGG